MGQTLLDLGNNGRVVHDAERLIRPHLAFSLELLDSSSEYDASGWGLNEVVLVGLQRRVPKSE